MQHSVSGSNNISFNNTPVEWFDCSTANFQRLEIEFQAFDDTAYGLFFGNVVVCGGIAESNVHTKHNVVNDQWNLFKDNKLYFISDVPRNINVQWVATFK
jgi:hypothetical protein